MDMPTLEEAKEKATEAKEQVVSWSARNLYNILAVVAAVVGVAVLVLCVFLNGLEKKVADDPPLPRSQAKVLVKKERAAEAKADSAAQAAVQHQQVADSSHQVAVRALKQADSLKARYEAIVPNSASSLYEIESRFKKYESPFKSKN